MEISKDHPRYRSLATREELARLTRQGVVADTGLIAHGRGEAFDYLLGERTVPEADLAERVSAAHLLEAERPVISVNGNVAALCADQIIELARAIPAVMEVNLFHRTEERVDSVCSHMEERGTEVLGRDPDDALEGIASDRSLCCREGIGSADVVLVPLEDGDRAQALVSAGKRVLAVDLNPLSRTSRTATVAIVDEVTRALPNILSHLEGLRSRPGSRRELIVGFSNQDNLGAVGERLCDHIREVLGGSSKA
ncbi:MAG: 4-phosphopantoate--beta-alanine ligase [Methanomassiliicoccales archaeon]